MNRVILIVLATLFAVQTSFADCTQAYQNHKTEVKKSAISSTWGGVGATTGGVSMLYVGAIVALATSNGGLVASSIIVAGVSVAGGIYISAKGISNWVEFTQKYKAYKLIQEAYIGAGDSLNEMAEDLSDELDRDVSEQEIAEYVMRADTAEMYCQAEQELVGLKELKQDLIDNL